MSWFTSLRRWKFRRELERELARSKPHRSRPHNLFSARRVCVLFPADSPEDRRQVDRIRQQRREEGFSTELFGYIDAKQVPEGGTVKLFGRGDLTWYGTPKEELKNRWTERTCDILLVLGPPDHQIFTYLTHLKNAELRVGPFSESSENPFDVLFAAGNTADLTGQLKRATDIFQIANAPPIPVAI